MADNLLDKASILLTPTASDNGSMLSVKPENGDGDFTFSRGSAATRVNAQGLVENVQILSPELVSNGNFSQGGQDWTLGSGWSIGDGKAIATDAAFGAQLVDDTTLEANKKYKVTFDISDYVKGNVRVGVGNVFSSEVSSNGSFTFIITSSNTNAFKAQTRAGGSGTTLSITNISVIEITEDTNLPRIDYTDGCGVWLLEPQSTNLYLNSDTLATQSNATSASTYTVSFYGTGTITFSGTHTGTLVGTGANDRVSATFTATSGTLVSTVSGTCTKGQLENLSSATSYIPTEGAASTRLQDIANNSGNSTLINSTEGVLYAEMASLADLTTQRWISIGSGGNSNRVSVLFKSPTNVSCSVRASSSAIYDTNFNIGTTTNNVKVAIRYKSSDFSFFVNGAKVNSQLSGALSFNSPLSELAFDSADGGSKFFGKVKALAVYKEALTDAQLQSLTTQ